MQVYIYNGCILLHTFGKFGVILGSNFELELVVLPPGIACKNPSGLHLISGVKSFLKFPGSVSKCRPHP